MPIDYESFKNGVTASFGDKEGDRYVEFTLRGVGKVPENATDEDIAALDEVLTRKVWDVLCNMFQKNGGDTPLQKAPNGMRTALMYSDERVLVWPNPTNDGYFIVELADGRCMTVNPNSLTFTDSREFFESWTGSDNM